MDVLSIDLETFSPAVIKNTGAYAYAAHDEFEILLFAYAWNDGPVQIVDLAQGEKLPDDVVNGIFSHQILKTAYNAPFERICLSRHFGYDGYLPADDWACTMVLGLTLGLPAGLDAIGKALNLAEDKQKLATGKALIRYFCVPCKPTKTNGGRTRNMPSDAPDKWRLFKEYCMQDVESERAIRNKLIKFAPLPEEQNFWVLDQKINDRGILIDTDLVKQALICDEQDKEQNMSELINLTGLENPNSGAQLKKWLTNVTGMEITSLTKETVPEIMKSTDSPEAKKALKLRTEISKTSVKKYQAMDNALGPDNRVRGLLQFYGANRTGRFSGRLVQVQNLPQNHLEDLDDARNLLKAGELGLIDLLYPSSQNVLSQLIRTAFIAKPGYHFVVADFSAIEARVIAWLAGEQWRLEIFNGTGKIYEASAAAMFHVPIEKIKEGNPEYALRAKGKVAELACGYGGGPQALINMGALKFGLSEEELPDIIKAWRKASPNIVKLWKTAEKAAHKAVQDKTTVEVQRGVYYIYENGILFAKLPSSRRLAYVRPRLEQVEKFGHEALALTYEGVDQTTKNWHRTSTYGGKLVENLIQAIARDCLRDAMTALDNEGYHTVMHVHDECVMEVPDGWGSVGEARSIMGRELSWAPGLPLRAAGFETKYYRKD
ncbi:MAG: DNA-directed polymerase [Firmicutes bacterium]|nr:DNA-directed polymerase [Bacillota bacterium]